MQKQQINIHQEFYLLNSICYMPVLFTGSRKKEFGYTVSSVNAGNRAERELKTPGNTP